MYLSDKDVYTLMGIALVLWIMCYRFMMKGFKLREDNTTREFDSAKFNIEMCHLVELHNFYAVQGDLVKAHSTKDQLAELIWEYERKWLPKNLENNLSRIKSSKLQKNSS